VILLSRLLKSLFGFGQDRRLAERGRWPTGSNEPFAILLAICGAVAESLGGRHGILDEGG
jgi:hypothetical protein